MTENLQSQFLSLPVGTCAEVKSKFIFVSLGGAAVRVMAITQKIEMFVKVVTVTMINMRSRLQGIASCFSFLRCVKLI